MIYNDLYLVIGDRQLMTTWKVCHLNNQRLHLRSECFTRTSMTFALPGNSPVENDGCWRWEMAESGDRLGEKWCEKWCEKWLRWKNVEMGLRWWRTFDLWWGAIIFHKFSVRKLGCRGWTFFHLDSNRSPWPATALCSYIPREVQLDIGAATLATWQNWQSANANSRTRHW